MKDAGNPKEPAAESNAQLEIAVPTALELQRLSLAVLIDIRQKFELEIQGEIPGVSFLPLFQFKKMLRHNLSPLEQEALDENEPELRGCAGTARYPAVSGDDQPDAPFQIDDPDLRLQQRQPQPERGAAPASAWL